MLRRKCGGKCGGNYGDSLLNPQFAPVGPRHPLCVRLSRRPLSCYRLLAADPDVVLRVAGGIVRIAGGIIRAEARLSGGIDRLIGVAAGEHERHKSKDDTEPHHRPPLLPE
jgi:hypothetical protein